MTEETPSLRMDFTPDQIVAGIARAVQEHEFEVIPGLVKYLATKDPHLAGEVLDALKGRVTISVDLRSPLITKETRHV